MPMPPSTATMLMQPIAVACGDFSGIGPEITLKAVAAEIRDPQTRFVLIGDRGHLTRWNRQLGLGLDLSSTAPDTPVRVLDPRPAPLPPALPPKHPTAAEAALDYLRAATEGCIGDEFAALVTAPVSKETILRTGIAFVGQTEFLAEACGITDVTMMLLGEDPAGRWLRVSLATTHLPLRRVADVLDTASIERAIRNSAQACADLGLPRARIAVCGLNPHAGEGGLLGDEEARTITPAINRARQAGLDVTGPLSADTVFHAALTGAYDAVVAMYHDQGLPTLKAVAFATGVNWTLGLTFIRTSPDHGTAFDIAGQGKADPSSMRAAVRLAVTLARRRLGKTAPPTGAAS
jgi:4-hydroxythreonine-4-phosphate dehydrogenase